MGRIVSNFFISLDGVVERPDQWHSPYFDDEMGQVMAAGMATSTAVLMGRRLYDEWSQYWPTAPDDGFGGFINGIDKHVLSTTLTETTWANSHLVSGDAVEAVRQIKASTEGDVLMSGCATTVRWLMAHGLLDELALLVHPVVVGTGQRLFEGTGTLPLELAHSQALGSGVLHLRYRPAAAQGATG